MPMRPPVRRPAGPSARGHLLHFARPLSLAVPLALAVALAVGLFALPVAGPLNAQVPTFRDVAGHDFGERITLHHQMVRYLERLADASDRVTIEVQGHSWDGRELMLAIVTSPENHARINQIRQTAQRLADPRTTSPAEAARLMEDQPAIVWLGGSIHGFELSGTEGVLRLLEHLTTRDDAETLAALRNAVVLIDPMLNPDGRDAFAHRNHFAIGRVPSVSGDDWSNDFNRWDALTYRTGYYFFDTNRDWFAHTQRETRERIPTFLAWRPQVAVDAHEMGPGVEFYFDPPTDPINPFFPEHSTRWFQRFGAAHAAAFDAAGIEYTQSEMFNLFYPGYTTAWSNFQGAVGMLYEQGSTRGLALERPDGSVRTLRDALDQQYVASWAAVRLAASERASLLRDYYDSHRAAVADGQRGVRRYVIAPEGDPGHVAELVNLLVRNGVEVQQLARPVRLSGVRDRTGAEVGAREFPAGSYVVEAAQPRNRLVRVLLEPQTPVPEAFLHEARARVDRAENPRFYDITAWSLPLLFDVGGYSTSDARTVTAQPVMGEVRPGDGVVTGGGPEALGTTGAPAGFPRAAYAYVIDGRQAAALPAVYHLRDQGLRGAVTGSDTRIQGETFVRGTVVLRVGQNDETLHDAVVAMAGRYGLQVRAVDSGRADAGHPALGAADMIPYRKPNIALVAEEPVHAYSFGWAWYTLDRQYEIPVTVLRAGSMAGMRLDGYDVIVLPELTPAAMATLLGEAGLDRLRRWVRDGGTLVTIGSATDFAREQLGLIALRSWYDTEAGRTAQRLDVPGVILRATVDSQHPLAGGYEQDLPVLLNSSRIYLEPEGPAHPGRRVVVRYAADAPWVAGHAWPETLDRVPGAVFMYEERAGRGRVIAFAEDVNFRAFWRGSDRLFLNSVLLP
jgi:hypothetical protein